MFTSNGSVSEPPCLTQIFLNDAFFNFTPRAYHCALNRIIAQPPVCELFSFQILNCFTKFFYCCSISYFILFYVYIFLLSLYIFLLPLYSIIIYKYFVVVCCKVWTLGVWGELACHKRLFNPPPQFSRLGTWCPTFLCASVLFVSCVYLDGGMGGGG